MRFLCKRCGTQSPGDLSEIEIRDGALVFTCKSCGASATLVENRAAGGAAQAGGGKPAEKGIVEPDEAELVDLGEATLSRMLGKNVRIVAADVAPDRTNQVPDGLPAGNAASVEPTPKAVGGSAAVVAVACPAFTAVPEEPSRKWRSTVFLVVAASVGLVAVATVALLEARPQRTRIAPPQSASDLGGPGPATSAPAEQPAPVVPPARPAESGNLAAAETATARSGLAVAQPATRVELPERAVPISSPSAPETSGASLSAARVEEALLRVRPAVRMCAQQERRRNPDTKVGAAAVVLTVAPTGEVTRVDFESPELAASPLGACLAGELRRFRVEAFSGPPAVVQHVLELSRPGVSTN